MIKRTESRIVEIGKKTGGKYPSYSLKIGGGNPIVLQSMCNTKTEDVEKSLSQIRALKLAGADLVRLTVPTKEAAVAFGKIREESPLPLVADIHFDYQLAILAMENGADKIRINPGNIGSRKRVQAVVDCAKERNIPIRIGVNSGSLEKDILEKYAGRVTAEGLAESALKNVELVENMGYGNLVLSIKSSDVLTAYQAHKIVAEKTNVPLHIGITEAGTVWSGNIKSAMGLALILHEGIGDTIRVSLSADPVEEIRSGKLILETLGLRKKGVSVVSCPTCGRTDIDLISLADKVEKIVLSYPDKALKVAVMGCVVNGPGEAREADLGIAGGKGVGLLFKKGEIIRKVKEEDLLDALREEIEKYS